MRKYILNSSVIGAVFGAFAAINATRRGPRDWRLILLWVSWGISVALAIGTVIQQNEDAKRARRLNHPGVSRLT